MYRCNCCGTVFDEPDTREETFHDDGRSCTLHEDICPICGEPHFEEIEEDEEDE